MSRIRRNQAPLQLPPCLPFLKWPGGKRWLAPFVAEIVGTISGTYFEPFLGGGAVFFYLRPSTAILSDCNERLVEVYIQVKDRVEEVILAMDGMQPSKSQFLKMRASDPKSQISRSAQFLYLNKTAFNGMYRVNRLGRFNVPYGCKPGTKVCDAAHLRRASQRLSQADIIRSDFEEVLRSVGANDVVYCDPPYTVKHDNNGFIRYNESLFSWADQEKLADSCLSAAKRGALVIVSNAHHGPIKRLYQSFEHRLMQRQSMISGSSSGRCSVSEYLFFIDGRGNR